jgi:BlaI family penicillinase repressor
MVWMQTKAPTRRELEIMSILWQRGEATVREVYEAMRDRAPIVQNTVQAFLRTMEKKGLVTHHTQGRAFVYRPVDSRSHTGRRLIGRILDNVFDGAVDQLVETLFSHKVPSESELARLEELISKAKATERVRKKKR